MSKNAFPSRRLHAIQQFEKTRVAMIHTLSQLVAFKSVSPGSEPNAPFLLECAKFCEKLFEQQGFKMEILTHENCPPTIIGSSNTDHPEAVTILVYAHYDVQPPDDNGSWESSPFEATVRNGRCFGRGTCDDKAAIVSFLEAFAAWRKTGSIPVNVRVVIEGGEEIGSPNLDKAVEKIRSKYGDVNLIVIMDTDNLAVGRPGITISLRGVLTFRVRVSFASEPVHSGTYGGLRPDPGLAMSLLLSRFCSAERVPGLDDYPALDEARIAWLNSLPKSNADEIGKEVGLFPGCTLAASIDPRTNHYGTVWFKSAINVIGLKAGDTVKFGNQVLPSCEAVLSVRTAPGQDTRLAVEGITKTLTTNPPWGACVKVDLIEEPVEGWSCNPDNPLLKAASDAVFEATGKLADIVGCGGSVGAVPVLTRILNAPAILLGIEDSFSNPHAPNESVHIQDWENTTRAIIHLLGILGGE